MRHSQLRQIVCLGLITAGAFLFVQRVGRAQQTVPFDGGIPVAPAGFEPLPIPAEPIEFDTAEVMRIRVVPVARQLVNPAHFLGSWCGDTRTARDAQPSASGATLRIRDRSTLPP